MRVQLLFVPFSTIKTVSKRMTRVQPRSSSSDRQGCSLSKGTLRTSEVRPAADAPKRSRRRVKGGVHALITAVNYSSTNRRWSHQRTRYRHPTQGVGSPLLLLPVVTAMAMPSDASRDTRSRSWTFDRAGVQPGNHLESFYSRHPHFFSMVARRPASCPTTCMLPRIAEREQHTTPPIAETSLPR